MQVLWGISELKQYLSGREIRAGCLADTGFLYAASFLDDRVYEKAVEAFDLFSEQNVAVFVNVISRMEFVDLVFRKQLTIGAVELFKNVIPSDTNKDLFNLLKNIRDQDAAHRRQGLSYKISEAKLKELRSGIERTLGAGEWREFCATHSGDMLVNEWEILEDELGLNFVEVMEGQTSDVIERPLRWSDMVRVMGRQGMRGPDAMISNIFLKSRLPLLVTTDFDLLTAFDEDNPAHGDKAILYLE